MAMLTPPPRIGKTTGAMKPASSMKKPATKRVGRKRKMKRVGLINRG